MIEPISPGLAADAATAFLPMEDAMGGGLEGGTLKVESIEQRLREIVAQLCNCEPDTVSASAPLFRGGLELDSQSAARLIESVEREFCISIADQDLDFASLHSLGTLARFVVGLCGPEAGER